MTIVAFMGTYIIIPESDDTEIETKTENPEHLLIPVLKYPDKSSFQNTRACQLCIRMFGIFTPRPHHCRVCRKCVCAHCCANEATKRIGTWICNGCSKPPGVANKRFIPSRPIDIPRKQCSLSQKMP